MANLAVASLTKGFTPTKPGMPPPAPGKPPAQNKNRAPAPAAHPALPKPKAARAAATPNPLAPLSPQQIRQQATKTIGAAYAPQVTDLNTQQAQAGNLYKTQQTDDQAFNQWLGNQTQAMQSQTDQMNQKMLDVMSGIVNTQNQQNAALPGQVAANTAATPGFESSQASMGGAAAQYMNPVLNALDQRTEGAALAEGGTALSGSNLVAGMGQVAQADMDKRNTAETNALNTTLTNIANERTKLNVARTGDVAKEIARLQGVEISKAQYQENQANLAAETGIKLQDANTAATVAKTGQLNAATNQEKADTQQLAQNETARHNAAMEQIDSTHYATTAAQAAAVLKEQTYHNGVMESIAQQNANTAASKAGVKGKAVKATATQQAEVVAAINSLRNAMITDIQKYGRQNNAIGLANAYHDINEGRYPSGVKSSPLGIPPVSLLNAAFNSLTQYGTQGLSQGDVQTFGQYGITLPYTVAKTSSTAGKPGAS